MKPSFLLLGAALSLSLGAGEADCANWPTKPLHIVVPVGAGSTADIIARLVFDQLSQQLGQSMVIENRTGAGGTIGTAFVAKAAPDGYTLLVHSNAHTIAPALYAKLSYDPATDFAAVIPLGTSPCVLVASPARGFKTAGDLIAAAKAKPGKMTFSSVGIGTATHFSAERFRASAHIEALHVPYRGGAEAMAEVMAGRVDFFLGPVGLVLPLVHDGKLVALAVNGTERSPALPDVPTTSEVGLANAEYPIWFGVFLPARTPREIVTRLYGQTVKVLRSPTVARKLANLGVVPMLITPEEFDDRVRKDIALNAALARAVGLQPN